MYRIVMLLLAACLFFSFFTACSDSSPSTYTSRILTIATYNVEDFGNSGASYPYQKVAQFVKDNNVDILLLQEVQPGDHPAAVGQWNYPANGGDASAFSSALSSVGVTMPYYGFSANGGLSGVYGDYLAYWSRYPVSSVSSILQGTYTDPVSSSSINCSSLRPVLRFKVTFNSSNEIWFYGVHLKAQAFSGSDPIDNDDIKMRRAQAHALEDYIKNNHTETSEHIVVLGDMNTAVTATDSHPGDDFADNSTLGYLSLKYDNPGNTANDFVPVNVAHLAANAWTHSVYSSRLDHIILSPAAYAKYIANSVKVVWHAQNDPADHYPVLLKLQY